MSEEIESLKTLMTQRFDDLEKRINDRHQFDDSNIKSLHDKDDEQDVRLNDHAERIRNLEQITAIPPRTAWDKIKDAFISWIVPFFMLAMIYYITHR